MQKEVAKCSVCYIKCANCEQKKERAGFFKSLFPNGMPSKQQLQTERTNRFHALWPKRKECGWTIIADKLGNFSVVAPMTHPHRIENRDYTWPVEIYEVVTRNGLKLNVPHYYYGSIHTYD